MTLNVLVSSQQELTECGVPRRIEERVKEQRQRASELMRYFFTTLKIVSWSLSFQELSLNRSHRTFQVII